MALTNHYPLDGDLVDVLGGSTAQQALGDWTPSQMLEAGRELDLAVPGASASFPMDLTAPWTLEVWMLSVGGGASLALGDSGIVLEADADGLWLVVSGERVQVQGFHPGYYHTVFITHDGASIGVALDGREGIERPATAMPLETLTISQALAADLRVVDVRGYDQALTRPEQDQAAMSLAVRDFRSSWAIGGLGGEIAAYDMSIVAGGKVVDQVGGIDAEIIGATPTTLGGVPAMAFDGEAMLRSDSTPAMIKTKNHTIAMLYRMDNIGRDGFSNLITLGSPGEDVASNYYSWRIDVSARLYTFYEVGAGANRNTYLEHRLKRDGKPHFLVLLVGDGIVSIYEDGVLSESNAAFGNSDSEATQVAIGANPDNGTDGFIGAIGAFTSYDRLLNESEVLALTARFGMLAEARMAKQSMRPLARPNPQGYTTAAVPVPNPSAIDSRGMSDQMVEATAGEDMSHVDQVDGSGANGTPTGGVSDPARMGVIAGTVLDIQAQPVSRRVRVHERATGRIVRETWSDADGKYRFTDLDPRRAFYVMAFDHTLQQNAVVSDNVHSEVEDSP
ncbi:LamG-like jellyroll fold domain-containing protein [Cobetia marina]|uniref:LamG-like jellyroll fold domain-containing protein n=1 Tax=Cobetia marina TaxID=28258 RepID=UPI0038574573